MAHLTLYQTAGFTRAQVLMKSAHEEDIANYVRKRWPNFVALPLPDRLPPDRVQRRWVDIWASAEDFEADMTGRPHPGRAVGYVEAMLDPGEDFTFSVAIWAADIAARLGQGLAGKVGPN